MSFDYGSALDRIRDARSKRGKVCFTKKFIDTLKKVNRVLPMFNSRVQLLQPYSETEDDRYSNYLLAQHCRPDLAQALVAKRVTGNGNCVFNSASLSLTGKEMLLCFHQYVCTIDLKY